MPTWQSHRSITLAALKIVGYSIPREVVRGLLDGVVDPDRVPDRAVKMRVYVSRGGRVRVRSVEGFAEHHKPSRGIIEYYFNLSLYHLRRGDGYRAGLMLGRALHYLQDGSLSRRRYLVVDVHDSEEQMMNTLAETPQRVEELCSGLDMHGRRSSSKAIEALCIAFRGTRDLLNHFVEEFRQPIDVKGLKKRIAKIRLAKILVSLASILPVAIYPPSIIVAALVIGAAILYRPKTYYEAMRAGILLLRPIGVRTAY